MKTAFQNFIIFMGAIVLGLGLCEIFMRVAMPQQLILFREDIWLPDSALGWRPAENLNTMVNTGERPVHLITDENGFRIDYNPEGKAETSNADVSLIVIGDSFVQGLQVENRETITGSISEMLSERSGLTVAGTNAGAMGWATGHYYQQAKRALAVGKYDLGIVCLWLIDDCNVGIDTISSPCLAYKLHRLKFPSSFSFAELKEKVLYPVNDLLETKSHLFIFLKNRFRNLRAKMGLIPKPFPDIFYTGETDPRRYRDTVTICRFIHEEFQRSRTPVFFVFLPAEFQVHEETFYDYVRWFDIPVDSVDLELPNRMLANAFQDESLHYMDMLRYMRMKADEGERLFGYIDLHLNREGNRAVAEHVLPMVMEYIEPLIAEN